MKKSTVVLFFISLIICSCNKEVKLEEPKIIESSSVWNFESLASRSQEHLDSSNWDYGMLNQDIQNYTSYSELFQSYPLNKSPFPVAEYEYAVFSIPFTLNSNEQIFTGLRVGEYKDFESEEMIDKLTLLVLSNNPNGEINAIVESRNYPYLAAQGSISVADNDLDWVFSASPDGYSNLIVNMKLFDLRFGETVVIYPQEDRSFFYDQIDDSPTNYTDFAAFEQSLLKKMKIQK